MRSGQARGNARAGRERMLERANIALTSSSLEGVAASAPHRRAGRTPFAGGPAQGASGGCLAARLASDLARAASTSAQPARVSATISASPSG